MATQKALVANNYGRGVYGVYSSTRHQHVWSMGTAYNLPDDGNGVGNLYGLSYTHTNVGSTSAAGLGHQLNGRANGGLQWALGEGMYTRGTITSSPQGTLWGSSNDGVSSTLDAGLLGGNYPAHYLNYNNLSNKPSIPTIPSSLPANGGNADTVDGLHVQNTQSTQNTANQILRTQNNGYAMLGWINTTSGQTTGMNRIYASNDGYIRYVTPATFGLGITPYINMPTTDTSWNYTGSAGKTSITGAIGTLGETQNAHAATQGSSNLRSVGISHNGKVCQDFVEQTWTLTRAEYNNMTANQMFTMINLGTSRGSNPGRTAIVTELVLMLKYSNPISGFSALGSYSGESIQILSTNNSNQNKVGGFMGYTLANMCTNPNARCEFLYQDRTYRRYWAEENIYFAKQDNSQLHGNVTHLCVKLRYKVYDGASF